MVIKLNTKGQLSIDNLINFGMLVIVSSIVIPITIPFITAAQPGLDNLAAATLGFIPVMMVLGVYTVLTKYQRVRRYSE